MALNYESLRPGEALRQITLPDPIARAKSLLEVKGSQQSNELRGLQIQGVQKDLDAQDTAHAQAAKVVEVLGKYGGDFEKALPELKAIAPQFGLTVEKEINDKKRLERTDAIAQQDREGKRLGDMAQMAQQGTRNTLDFERQQLDVRQQSETERHNRAAEAKPPTPESLASDEKAIDALMKRTGMTYDAAYRQIHPMTAPAASTVVIQTSEGPQLVNKRTGEASPITTAGGDAVKPAPTADMRNKEAGRALVGKSIAAIKDLGDKIIARVGPAQRLDAIKRGAEAVFGSDPEFRTYQDARMALAGNLAVAQQGSRPSDADIMAIWLPLVPDPYRDTRESSAMKWTLINTMSNTNQDAAPKAGSGGPPVGTMRGGYRFAGGDPSDEKNWKKP